MGKSGPQAIAEPSGRLRLRQSRWRGQLRVNMRSSLVNFCTACPTDGPLPASRHAAFSQSSEGKQIRALLQRVTGQRIGAIAALHWQSQALGPSAVEVALIAEADVIEAIIFGELQAQATI